MGLYSVRLIIGELFTDKIWGGGGGELIFGRAYFWVGFLLEFYGM